MQKVLVLLGSNRPNRKTVATAEWFKNQVTSKRSDMEFEFVDIDDLNLPMYNEPAPAIAGRYEFDYTKAWSAKVASADAFVFMTPEYNHGYPAVLKNAIDYLYHEWKHKPVAFVGHGVNGGVRSIEQLRQVVSNLQMVSVSTNPSPNFSVITDFADDGSVKPDEQKVAAANMMLDELKWWSEALSTARVK